MQTYIHTQAVASATWTIDHNLDLTSLMIETFLGDGNASPILPLKITKTTPNQVVVIFSTARAGSARVLGSSGMFVDYSNYVAPVERTIDYTLSPDNPVNPEQ